MDSLPVISGPLGKLSTCVKIPEETALRSGKCPAVIMMHGFSSSKETAPFPEISKALTDNGIAVICFDFQAHGQSEGNFEDMTISGEIADAKAVLEYTRSLPFVSDIAFLGHSQGGLVASMLAGELESTEQRPRCLILLAPSASIKFDVQKGRYMNAWFDPANPPEYINVLQHKIGRNFIVDAQQLPVYETATRYSGKVCIIHGEKDFLVPLPYSKRFQQEYQHCDLVLLPNAGHTFNEDKELLIQSVVGFVRENLR